MSHQTQLEKLNYRNWVKGGLSMKYLKDGLETFADDVVRQDHTRILQLKGHTTGLICTACTIRDLKPVHKYAQDSTTKRKFCPRGQSNCNCLYPNKSRCPNKICDAIYEEILNSHASTPPAPCWKNTDITKWVTHPWEIAKCFINSPGYRDKQSAEKIDVAGLLHVFINNTMYQTSLSCLISGNKSDAFCKALDLRNKIFHSPNMELEDQDLNECLTNVVSILEDEKKLKNTLCAKEAVDKIKQLQNQEFIITTETEAVVLRDIVEQLREKHLELEKGHSAVKNKHLLLEKGHSVLEDKHLQLEKGHSVLEDKHLQLEKGHSVLEDKHIQLKKGHSELEDKHLQLEKVNSALEDKQRVLEKGHSALEENQLQLEKGHSELEEKQLQLEKGHSELEEKHLDLEKVHSALEDKHLQLEKVNSALEEKQLELEKGHSALEAKHLYLEKEHSALDKKQSDLSIDITEQRKTHLKLEKEHSDIDKRLVNVERDVEILKNLHQKKLISVEKRLEARRKLAEHLQKHYVKTSVSPFKARENAIDIDKVYVEPQIETEKKDEQNEKRTVSLTSYRGIFQSDGHRIKRIYLLGEVGSGKSAFCKMMTLYWCRSVKNDQTMNAKEDNGNVEAMKQFDFLFYLPLRRLQKGGRIREMILWYYKDQIPVEILDDILLNIPEKCLILADGLDEWTPNYDEQRPLHVTASLPYSEDIKEVTLLMTSRPFAPGVLNMAFTEFDLKITMCGIPAKSIDSMTDKYLLSLMKEANKYIVLKKLKARKIDRIEKTPLLLQQLIWMIANDIDVGHCLSDNYSSLVNIALKWTEEKVSQKKLKTVSSSHIHAELCLPSKLMEYDAYWWNRNLLFILGKIAFDLLINAESQMSFGRAKLNRDGLDDDVIDMILNTGLLTEDNCHDNTKQKTQLSFTHASFQEYFAALYIASHDRIKQNQIPDDMKQMPSPDARSQPQNEDILELFFRRCSSVQGILQFGVVLRFLCGLDSKNLSNVCELIYQTAQRDEEYSVLRDKYLMEGLISRYDGYVRTTLNLQKLIKSCSCECTVKDETSFYKIPVLDLILSDHKSNDYKALLQCAISQKVLNLSVICRFGFGLIRPDLYENYVVEFHNLQTIAIELYRRDLPITALSQHISKTNSIRKIKFIKYTDIDGLPVVTVNLRGHHQLQLINVSGVIMDINFDTSNLEIIKQKGSPSQHPYLNVYFHELSTGVVIPKLRHLELSLIFLTLELAKFISHNVTLNVLRLRNLLSYGLQCVIDLSAHNNLQVLEIVDSFKVGIKSVNTINLTIVITDSSDVLHAVRNAPRLTSLTFDKNVYFTFCCFTKLMNEDVCSCSQLQKVDLKRVKIQDEALVMSSGMKNLKRITLDNVDMSQSTWIRFVNSLLNLKQSVTVKAIFKWYLIKSLSDNENKFQSQSQYIRDNENKFKLIESDAVFGYLLTFETVPK